MQRTGGTKEGGQEGYQQGKEERREGGKGGGRSESITHDGFVCILTLAEIVNRL